MACAKILPYGLNQPRCDAASRLFSRRFMNIEAVNVYYVRIPLKKQHRMADVPIDYVDSVFLELRSEGVSGWGEVFPGNEPVLTAAWTRGVYVVLTESLLPRLMRAPQVASGEKLAEFLEPVKGNRHAKGVLDLAWWDLFGKQQEKPLHHVLGGTRRAVEVGLVFDRYENRDRFLDDLHAAVSEGFRRITLKIRPGWDIAMLAAVRNSFPTLMIQCDVEGALSMDQHADTIYRFDDFMPSLLEQPLAASEYVGHAMLQDSLRTTIGLDESVTNLLQAQIALDLRSGGTFCLKAGKMGGLTEVKRIHDAVIAAEGDCYSGFDIHSSIGYRFALAIASLSGCELPADYVRFSDYLSADPGVPLLPELQEESVGDAAVGEFSGGHSGVPTEIRERRQMIRLWDEPGIGFEPDRKLLEKLAISTFSLP